MDIKAKIFSITRYRVEITSDGKDANLGEFKPISVWEGMTKLESLTNGSIIIVNKDGLADMMQKIFSTPEGVGCEVVKIAPSLIEGLKANKS